MLPNFYPPKVVYISDLYVSTALMRSCNAYDVGTGVISPRLDQHPRPRPAADRGGVPRVHETPHPRRAGVKLFPMDGDRDRVFLLSPEICYAGIQEKPYPGIFFMEVLL